MCHEKDCLLPLTMACMTTETQASLSHQLGCCCSDNTLMCDFELWHEQGQAQLMRVLKRCGTTAEAFMVSTPLQSGGQLRIWTRVCGAHGLAWLACGAGWALDQRGVAPAAIARHAPAVHARSHCRLWRAPCTTWNRIADRSLSIKHCRRRCGMLLCGSLCERHMQPGKCRRIVAVQVPSIKGTFFVCD